MAAQPPVSAQPVYAQLNVWGYAVGSAAAGLVLGILALPLHAMERMHAYGPMSHGGAGFPAGFADHPGAAAVEIVVALAFVAICFGIGGAIIAAVHNAMSRR